MEKPKLIVISNEHLMEKKTKTKTKKTREWTQKQPTALCYGTMDDANQD